MKNFAIILGHTEESKGACSTYGIPCEWDYNEKVSSYLGDIADIYTHGTYSRGYTSMVKETANKVNEKEYRVALYLHYNSAASASATGSEVLYYSKSIKGPTYAKNLAELISKRFALKNRGAKALLSKDRGFGEVYYLKTTALIVEPFFGSNSSDVAKFKGNEEKYSQVLREFLTKL